MSRLSGEKAASVTAVTAAQSSADAAQAAADKILATVPGTLSLLNGSAVRYVHVGDDATIGSIQAVLDGAMTAASSVGIAVTINGNAVTDGGLSIAAANAGDDTVHTSTPSAANTVSAGDVVKFVVTTAANMVDTKAAISMALTRA